MDGNAPSRDVATDHTGHAPNDPVADRSKPALEQTSAAGRPESRTGQDRPTRAPAADAPRPQQPQQPEGEKGGPTGPEPTRYGDWEKGGRCFDF